MDANETAFDLNRYLRVCGATKPECFDWTTPQPRLGDDALFTIAYMMDIESHTIVTCAICCRPASCATTK